MIELSPKPQKTENDKIITYLIIAVITVLAICVLSVSISFCVWLLS